MPLPNLCTHCGARSQIRLNYLPTVFLKRIFLYAVYNTLRLSFLLWPRAMLRNPQTCRGAFKFTVRPQRGDCAGAGLHLVAGRQTRRRRPRPGPDLLELLRPQAYIGGQLKTEADPDRKEYGNLAHPPFLIELTDCYAENWGDLKIEGYLGGKLAITKTLSGKGADAKLLVEPDDAELVGDASDATRVVLRVTDEYGSPRQVRDRRRCRSGSRARARSWGRTRSP